MGFKNKCLMQFTFLVILILFLSGCTQENNSQSEDGYITFDYAPVDLGENLGHIKPMGLIGGGGHVTPTDHIYFITPDWVSANQITCDIFSPADGMVKSIQKMTSQLGGATELEYDYRIVIQS